MFQTKYRINFKDNVFPISLPRDVPLPSQRAFLIGYKVPVDINDGKFYLSGLHAVKLKVLSEENCQLMQMQKYNHSRPYAMLCLQVPLVKEQCVDTYLGGPIFIGNTIYGKFIPSRNILRDYGINKTKIY